MRREAQPCAVSMLKNNRIVQKLVETGEVGVGRLAQQVLSNEKFVSAVQSLVTRSMAAKGTFETSMRKALEMMNLPSATDVESLRTKVEDLEQLLTSVERKMDQLTG